MSTKHTPGEMKQVGKTKTLLCIGDKTIAIMSFDFAGHKANSDRFVLTWNAHDDLLAACKAAIEYDKALESCANDCHILGTLYTRMIDAARKAFAKVEGASLNIPKLIVNEIGLDPEGGAE